LVTACHPVKPEKFYINHQVDGKCYKQLPVQVKGQVVFVVPSTHDINLQLPEVSYPWKPPHKKHLSTPEIGANKFTAEHALFTGNNLPDLEHEWIKLAIDRMQRKGLDEITRQASDPLKQWATSTEEFL
uniref:CFAP221 n=1 Tax=Enterobius vermicularis TaxID=51028 RepID=A0A0N4UTI0_ENTVE